MRDQRYPLRGRLIAEKNPPRHALIFRFRDLCSICYKIASSRAFSWEVFAAPALCCKQPTVSHRRNSGRGRRSDRRIRRLRNPAPFGRRVACQRHFRRFARRLGRDRTRLFLRYTLTPAAARASPRELSNFFKIVHSNGFNSPSMVGINSETVG